MHTLTLTLCALLAVCACTAACDAPSNAQTNPTHTQAPQTPALDRHRPSPPPQPKKTPRPFRQPARYPWLAEIDTQTKDVAHLSEVFEPPKGYTRVSVDASSFGAWLRELPVLRAHRAVRSYRGETLSSPGAAIVPMDLGTRDLQQCADSILRLHGEYLWSRKRQSEVGYHFTSGDLSTWRAWQKGERFRIEGRSVKRVRTRSGAKTHRAFVAYLQHTFRYAGTMSMHRDSSRVGSWEKVQPGDFVVSPGSPGHAVLVLDVAQNAQGRKVALLGQGFMPAQDFHVLRASHAQDRVWFPIPETNRGTLDTPSWQPFASRDLRRMDTL